VHTGATALAFGRGEYYVSLTSAGSSNRAPGRLVTWDGERLVAAGSGAVTTQTDGLPRSAALSTVPGTFNDLIWDNRVYLMVGDAGQIARSENLSTWSMTTVGNTQRWLGVASGAGVQIAVGENGAIARSPDGLAWTLVSSGVSASLRDVLWDGTRFIAVGNQGTIIRSPDGRAWSIWPSGTTENLTTVSSSENRTVVAGERGGIYFTGAPGPEVRFDSTQQRVSSSSFTYPLRITAKSAWTITGLPSWITVAPSTAAGDAEVRVTIAANPSEQPRRGVLQVSNEPHSVMQQSATDRTWALEFITSDPIDRVASDRAGTVVVSSFSSRVWTSRNRAPWTSVSLTPTTEILMLTYQNELFFASGPGSTLQTSPDGLAWTARSIESGQISDVAWGNGLYVAVGTTISTSTDAVTWTARPGSAPDLLYSVAHGRNRFVAVGKNGTIVTSENGAVWTQRPYGVTQPLYSVAWNGTRFLAVGNRRTVLTSIDGVTWQLLGSDAPGGNESEIADAYRRVIWDGARWLAAAATVVASPDGVVWTPVTSGFLPRDLALDRDGALAPAGAGRLARQTQSPADASVAVAPNLVVVNPAGVTYTLAISTSGPWTITGIPSWIATSAASGTGPAAVQVIVAPNTSTSNRAVTLTLGSARHTVSQSASIAPYSPTIQTSLHRNDSFTPKASVTTDVAAYSFGTALMMANNLGTEPYTLQWRRDGLPIAGATGMFLSLHDQRTTDSGTYDLAVTRLGVTTITAGVDVTVLPPVLARVPTSTTIAAGENLVIFNPFLPTSEIAPGGVRWLKNNEILPGSAPTLQYPVKLGDDGAYQLEITTFGGETFRSPVYPVAAFEADPGGKGPVLINLSARNRSGLGADALFTGFILRGEGAKRVVLRGIGPSLGQFGITNWVADPTLNLYNDLGLSVATGLNWQNNDGRDLGAFPLAPGSLDAVIDQGLGAGLRTVELVDHAGRGGDALTEIYLSSPTQPGVQLINLSTRSRILAGEQLTVGFVLVGPGSTRVLVRAIGPGLETFQVPDVAADPELTLNRIGAPTTLVFDRNDDWAPSLVSAFAATGAFPLQAESKDAALVITLAAGSYTAAVSNKSGAAGIALVEIYLIGP